MLTAKWGYSLPRKWDNVRVEPHGHGHYKIYIQYNKKTYSAVTSCMPWIDQFKSKERGWKTAGEYLYNYVKKQNNLR